MVTVNALLFGTVDDEEVVVGALSACVGVGTALTRRQSVGAEHTTAS